MRKYNHSRKARLNGISGAKITTIIMSFVLVCGFAVGGTVAWLISETDPILNTFTYGDINITLTETDTGDNDNNPNTNEYTMVPGSTIEKDPKITVKEGSEASWLFVKIEESANFDTFMECSIADGWTELVGETGVYYREVAKSDSKQEFGVISNNTVSVRGEGVTKEMLNALDKDGAENYPTLTVTAYAVQRDNIATVAEAWAIAEAN